MSARTSSRMLRALVSTPFRYKIQNIWTGRKRKCDFRAQEGACDECGMCTNGIFEKIDAFWLLGGCHRQVETRVCHSSNWLRFFVRWKKKVFLVHPLIFDSQVAFKQKKKLRVAIEMIKFFKKESLVQTEEPFFEINLSSLRKNLPRKFSLRVLKKGCATGFAGFYLKLCFQVKDEQLQKICVIVPLKFFAVGLNESHQ